MVLSVLNQGLDQGLVTKAVAHRALLKRPNLARHACNTRGRCRFGQVLEGTEIQHLVEHVAVDLLVERFASQNMAFAGNSSWATPQDRQRGIMRISVAPAKQNAAVKRNQEALCDAIEAALVEACQLVDSWLPA